ncbi:unnamed protein product, partial [Prorocentrum cordatum]
DTPRITPTPSPLSRTSITTRAPPLTLWTSPRKTWTFPQEEESSTVLDLQGRCRRSRMTCSTSPSAAQQLVQPSEATGALRMSLP